MRTKLAACLVAVTAEAADSGPATVIRALNDTYKAVLKQARALKYEGRYQELEPAISQAFDFAFMARAVIGREWNDLPADQQTRWVQTFHNFTIANYAAQMDHAAGQVFEILGEQPGENDTTMVLSRVVEPGAETVNLNYRLRQTPDGWKIIDIYAKGNDPILQIGQRLGSDPKADVDFPGIGPARLRTRSIHGRRIRDRYGPLNINGKSRRLQRRPGAEEDSPLRYGC